MKENFNRELIDLRKFDNPINPIDLIQNIISNPNIENDPFYIVDLEDICNKHINWITKLPRVEPHYAVKCNTDSMLLKLLAFLGAGFDCASKNEIQQVLDLGVSPDRIIFANPCKQSSYIKYAYKMGVNYMTFDNENELYKIKQNHPNAKCVLRIITNDANAICRFSMKFGADMQTSLKLIELAVQLNLDLVGISFHVGSGQMSPETFSESIQNARKLFDYAREQFGCRMNFLDLGGGYPGSSDSTDLFDLISREINRSLEENFPAETFNKMHGLDEDNKLRIIAEPGRYYACSAFTLCVNVIAKRVMEQTDSQQEHDKESVTNLISSSLQNPSTIIQTPNQINSIQDPNAIDYSKSMMYYINDGVYASFNCLFYDHAECYPVILKDDLSSNKFYKSSIWGPTCDGLDLVCKELFLPNLECGEFMVFKNMGAYTISGAVAFNGIPLAKCIYIASTSWDTIKNAFVETYQETDSLINTVFNNTCHGSAFQRALSGVTAQQQIMITCCNDLNNLEANHLELLDSSSNCSDQSNEIDHLADELNLNDEKCIEKQSVDCAITC